MRVFLFDTNIWGYWFDADRYPDEHRNIQKHLNELPANARIGISVITWGEIAVGLNGSSPEESSVQVRHLQFLTGQKPLIEDISTHTAEEYGRLRGRLRDNVLKRKKSLRAEELVDRFTWLELGSLENDLWIAAQAIAKNLTLVTNDELKEIHEAAGEDLHTENWAAELGKK
jgi:predicted nucleic acid-binding protein